MSWCPWPLTLLVLTALGTGCGAGLPFSECTEPLASHEAAASRFLHQEGAALVEPTGEAVVLRTVNLGGWLHWESWMFGGGLEVFDLEQGSESQLLARLDELYGAAAAERFAGEIRDGFVHEADFQQIAELGFDSVRIPINHTLVDTEEGLQALDQGLVWAETHGLRVILDMHAAPGGQSDMFMADPDGTLLWDSPAHQDELVADWTLLAQRYADSSAVAGYDLLNEPAAPDPQTLIALYERILQGVRAHDTEHLVFIEGHDLSRSFDGFTERIDPNMAYSPHVYLWLGYPDQQWLDSLGELEACHDVPVWVGEFGEDRLPDIEKLRVGFEDLSGWAVWSWKKVDEGGTPGIGLIDAPADWLSLMESLNAEPGTEAAMDETAAFDALDRFLAAAASPRIDPAVVSALGLD